MGAGISSKALYKKMYNRLDKIRRDVNASGGNLTYKNRELNGFVGALPVNIYYSISYASNGECAGFLYIWCGGMKMELGDLIKYAKGVK